MSFTWWRYPTRRFVAGGVDCAVAMRARGMQVESELSVCGVPMASDSKPMSGPAATENHKLEAVLPDGRTLAVEAGYASIWTMGAVARIDGTTIYESHPGQTIAFPKRFQKLIGGDGDPEHDWSNVGAFAPRNRLPLAMDIATGLLFYVVARATDLTTAALVGVAVGIALVVFQRVTRIDVTGGLALFGIVMLCISAGLALAFQSDEWVKMRGTITGSIAATLFIIDGSFGGKRLATGLARYMPYPDIDPGRLGIGMGMIGLVMAGLNLLVARVAPTEIWLFYTTFLDVFVAMGLAVMAIGYARRKAVGRS